MPRQQVKRWGNSLAVRIPAGIAETLRLREDSDVELGVQDGSLLIKPAGVKQFSMARYLEQLRAGKLELAPLEDLADEPKGSESGGPDDPARDDKW